MHARVRSLSQNAVLLLELPPQVCQGVKDQTWGIYWLESYFIGNSGPLGHLGTAHRSDPSYSSESGSIRVRPRAPLTRCSSVSLPVIGTPIQ